MQSKWNSHNALQIMIVFFEDLGFTKRGSKEMEMFAL